MWDMVQEQMRLEALMKEEAQLTFKPSVNQYNDVRAHLNLRHPEAYLAQVDAKRQAQLAQRLEERRTREVTPSCSRKKRKEKKRKEKKRKEKKRKEKKRKEKKRVRLLASI